MATQALKSVDDVNPASPPPKRSRRNLLIVAAAATAMLGALVWWIAFHGIEDTDDAQIDGDVVNVPARTSALVKAIHFQDNQPVAAGELLAELDDAPARVRLAQAEAELESATAAADSAIVQAGLTATNARGQHSAAIATLTGAHAGVSSTADQIAEADAQLRASLAVDTKAKLDLDRAKQLLIARAVPQAQLDAAQAAFDAAEAQVAQARAHAANVRSSSRQVAALVSEANARLAQAATVDEQIADAQARTKVARARVESARAQRDQAALDLSYTKIYAPQGGVISRRAINVGQMVTTGSSVAALVPTAHLWVTGNFKETQLRRMKPGQQATVKIEAYGVELHGTVESFSAATGARFSLLPPDNATGNYTKIVQRLPVRIALADVPATVALRPGLSVDLAVDTRR
jgi:membrane fusion protein (multidrug efflux system)